MQLFQAPNPDLSGNICKLKAKANSFVKNAKTFNAQGAKTSASSASGKHSVAASTKRRIAMGPAKCPHHPPLSVTWIMLKAAIRLPVSSDLTTTRHIIVGPLPILPGRPKTELSLLSLPAKLNPELKQETNTERAILCSLAMGSSSSAMAVTPAT